MAEENENREPQEGNEPQEEQKPVEPQEPQEEAKEKKEAKKKNPWLYSTVAMTILFVAAVFISLSATPASPTGMVVADQVPAQEAADNAVDYINNNLLQPGTTAELLSVEEEQDLYKVGIKIGANNYDSYVTKDGRLLFTTGIDLNEVPEVTTTTVPQAEKTEKPKAHAFIMSYCPYGLQFLKAYVPVIELLGEKADLELNFVSYIMHGEKEIDENNRMYCVQKEENDKFTDYLRCFVETDDPEGCMESSGIDKSKIETCIAATDEQFKITELYNDQSTWSGGRFPMYPVDGSLNTQYAVRGSPTFVLNGQQMSVARSAEAIKQAVCNAFINPPEECNQQLSAAPEGPGIGPIGSGSGSDSTAQC